MLGLVFCVRIVCIIMYTFTVGFLFAYVGFSPEYFCPLYKIICFSHKLFPQGEVEPHHTKYSSILCHFQAPSWMLILTYTDC